MSARNPSACHIVLVDHNICGSLGDTRSSRVVLTLDYADDISLLSDNMQQAQELLTRVEAECAKVGLRESSLYGQTALAKMMSTR